MCIIGEDYLEALIPNFLPILMGIDLILENYIEFVINNAKSILIYLLSMNFIYIQIYTGSHFLQFHHDASKPILIYDLENEILAMKIFYQNIYIYIKSRRKRECMEEKEKGIFIGRNVMVRRHGGI